MKRIPDSVLRLLSPGVMRANVILADVFFVKLLNDQGPRMRQDGVEVAKWTEVLWLAKKGALAPRTEQGPTT